MATEDMRILTLDAALAAAVTFMDMDQSAIIAACGEGCYTVEPSWHIALSDDWPTWTHEGGLDVFQGQRRFGKDPLIQDCGLYDPAEYMPEDFIRRAAPEAVAVLEAGDAVEVAWAPVRNDDLTLSPEGDCYLDDDGDVTEELIGWTMLWVQVSV